jgi:hypothetical protein
MWVVPTSPPDGAVAFEMPMPPDRMTSFDGSGLPFPNAHVAYSPSQRGVCTYANGKHTLAGAHTPNVYVGDGGVVGAPEAVLRYASAGVPVEEAVPVHGAATVPHRNVVSSPFRTGPEFYDHRAKLPVRSQEQILRDGAFGHGSVAAVDYGWGSRPRV